MTIPLRDLITLVLATSLANQAKAPVQTAQELFICDKHIKRAPHFVALFFALSAFLQLNEKCNYSFSFSLIILTSRT